MTRLVALICSAFLLGGCAGLQRLADLSFVSPRVTLAQASIAQADLDGATVRLDLLLENPNDVAFEVAQATWRLEVEQVQVGEGALPGGLGIPARGTAPFAVTVRVRWADVQRLVERVGRIIAPLPVRVHFHNTRNTGLANVWAAVIAGASIVDASVGGLGGCPFAPGAAGNVPSEDVVYMLERAGIDTGMDLDRLIEASHWLSDIMGRKLPGMVAQSPAFPVAA